MTKVFVFSIVILLAILVVGCTSAPAVDNSSKVTVGSVVDTPNGTPKEEPAPSLGNIISTGYYGKILAGDKSPYIEFNTKDYERATSDGKIILLYFYSDVGTLSRAEEYKLFRAFDEMDSPYMIGFKVHYEDSQVTDAEKQLATTLEVKESRTKIIMKNGKIMQKSTGTWDIGNYAAQMSVFLT
jgi:hypothetical protein